MKLRAAIFVGAAVLSAAIVTLPAMAQEGKFTIKGNLERNGSIKIGLYRYTEKSGKTIDTLSTADGQFLFKGTVDGTETGQILFSEGQRQSGMVFYLEPGTIHIDCPGDGDHAIIKGTPLNNDLQQFKEMLNVVIDSMNAAEPARRMKLTQFSPEVLEPKVAVLRKFILAHPGSKVGLDQLTQYAIKSSKPDIVEPLLHALKPVLRDSKGGQELALRIQGMRTAIGSEAPSFTLPDTQGHNVSLTDFRGKYVLIDFWATWCGPCMEEMPNVARAFHQYKDKNFTIVGVSLDRPDSKDKWLNVIDRDHLDWIQVSDLNFWNSKAALAYNINSVPANFLIGPDGKIVARNLRGEALQTKLAELFK
jgi:peroxiredoxin